MKRDRLGQNIDPATSGHDRSHVEPHFWAENEGAVTAGHRPAIL
jgi:hypothetical protein